MASIGSFGKRYEQVDLDFDYFGDTIRVNPKASKAAMVEFVADATGVDIDDEVKGAKLIMRFLREVVHPDDFDRFWSLAKSERQDPMKDLMPIGQAILEAVSGFPTGQSSTSAAGSTPTPPRFEVDLPSQDIPAPALPVPPGVVREVRRLPNRPDLHVATLEALEARSRMVSA